MRLCGTSENLLSVQVPTVWLMTKPLKHCSVLQMRSTRRTSRPPSWCPQMTRLQRCCTPWGLQSSSFWQTLPCEPVCCLLYLHICINTFDQSQAFVLIAVVIAFTLLLAVQCPHAEVASKRGHVSLANMPRWMLSIALPVCLSAGPCGC